MSGALPRQRSAITHEVEYTEPKSIATFVCTAVTGRSSLDMAGSRSRGARQYSESVNALTPPAQ